MRKKRKRLAVKNAVKVQCYLRLVHKSIKSDTKTTTMSVLFIVWPRYMLAALRAAPWRVTVCNAHGTDGRTRRTPDRYITLSAKRG